MKKRVEALKHPTCACGRQVIPRWAGVPWSAQMCLVARNRDGLARRCTHVRLHECDTCGYPRRK
jgi:hypothetical protein